MLNHHYCFVTRWSVDGTREEVFRIIEDTPAYVRWWPAVWLRVEIIEPGDTNSVGRVTRVLSKGWLPYLLSWTAVTHEKVFPERIAIEAAGDFQGRGCWTFDVSGAQTNVQYVWEIEARKPLLRYGSWLLRPIFAANHRWAMDRGLESLRLELARRRATSEQERASIPDPPGPVFVSGRRRRRLGLALEPSCSLAASSTTPQE